MDADRRRENPKKTSHPLEAFFHNEPKHTRTQAKPIGHKKCALLVQQQQHLPFSISYEARGGMGSDVTGVW
jgi:hypothetical protein